MSRRLRLHDGPIITDDSKGNFEEAIERRLAATKGTGALYDVHTDEDNDDVDTVRQEQERELRRQLQHSSTARRGETRAEIGASANGSLSRDAAMSRIGSTSASTGTRTPVMDKDGLGWPAKGSLHRLRSTPLETANTTAKLSAAVKTILECLGEDPEREGLKRTPERYAKAMLWMTRGYEERLSGELRAMKAPADTSAARCPDERTPVCLPFPLHRRHRKRHFR